MFKKPNYQGYTHINVLTKTKMYNFLNSFADYFQAYKASIETPDKFWAAQAESFTWHKPFQKVLDWEFSTPKIQWFIGGKLNICENAIDRHLPHKANQTAIIWESNDVNEPSKHISYQQLYEQVNQIAYGLKELGVAKGDKVIIYMPMVPELMMSLLACARIGAVHSVVFAGFSATSLADRINDCKAKVVLTADGGYRGAKTLPVKEIVDEALRHTPTVESCLVLPRTFQKVDMKQGRDYWWHDVVPEKNVIVQPESMDAEDELFILYTSGSTGKPKGVVHSMAGYMVYADYTFRNVFQYREGEVFWCTADVGWITGHTYLTYGPLLAGATTLCFEGIPTWPDPGRFWQVVDKHKVNIFYTAPTAIRSLMACGNQYPDEADLGSLRVLGSVGEPINEEAWHWYHSKVGRGRCPVTDTWWQTETGGIMMAPLAGITPTKPGFATLPLPGVMPVLVDNEGKILEGNAVEGNLCLAMPTPGMLRTTFGDHERCRQTYFSTYPNYYFTGDGCRRDEDGYYRILGRVDDVINVSGHRIGTAEVENAICEHPIVSEAAVVGYPHEIKGQGIYAFIVSEPLEAGQDEAAIRAEVMVTVSKIIGPIAKPDQVQFVSGLPKTRSGKIMRRILRKIVEQDLANLGDTSTLLDPNVVQEIIEGNKQIRAEKA